MQLTERALEPGGGVLQVEHVADRHGRGRRHLAVLDDHRGAGGRRLEQVPQRCRRLLGAGKGGLQAAEVTGDQRVPGEHVRRRDDLLYVLQRHVQRPEPADHLGRGDLVGGVAAVTGAGVHVGRLEQADAVVMPQRLDA